MMLQIATALPDTKTLAVIVSVVAIVLIAVVAVALLRGWTFGKWMRKQILDEIVSYADGTHFRKAAQDAVEDFVVKQASICVSAHNDSPDAHGIYRRQAEAFTRALVAENITLHNDNLSAHHAALREYPDRKELNGAIGRIELKIEANQQLIIERLGFIATQITEIKRDQERARHEASE